MSAPFADIGKGVHLKSRGNGTPPLRGADRPRAADTEPIDSDTRLFVWQRDRGRCRNCGSKKDLHFDHIIPRSWGGSSTVENVQVLCRTCNLRKGASLIDGGTTR